MFAYSVVGRKWVHIDSRYLKRMKHKGEESEAFILLQMDEDNKEVIDSLVRAHLQTKQAERQGFEIETQDLIRGKGKGIIILLHGPPGVGKTATAEAVAQKWRRPLFPSPAAISGSRPSRSRSLSPRSSAWPISGTAFSCWTKPMFLSHRETDMISRGTPSSQVKFPFPFPFPALPNAICSLLYP